MEPCSTLNAYIAQSVRENWDHQALTDFDGPTYSYRDVARKVAKLHILFNHAGLVQGDKIAICGRNSSHWAIVAIASLTYGTVAVPILHDFKAETVHNLVCHSEAKLLFTDTQTWENLDHEHMPHIKGVLQVSDYSLIYSRNKQLTEAREKLNRFYGEKYPERFTPADVDYPDFEPSQLAVINYTSGSMGFSKGVMLSYNHLWSNIQYSIDGLSFLKPGDGTVCMLPLAHMFGFAIEMLHPFVKGCNINFLTRTPSPRIIMEAFAKVHPKLVITVPLVIEKIIRTRVFPMLDKPLMKVLMAVPVVNTKLLEKIRTKLIDSFGGNLLELIVGGAPLNKDVEAFLRRIKFPYTIGYGMTECGPLISYAPWNVNRAGSCGRLVDRMEARIDSPDPLNTPGVLWVRGQNVMQGYFKNPEETKAVFDSDGWMRTGDVAQTDADGFLYLRGRDKSMILGPSGQNIYPEEIEQILNNQPYVAESLIVERDGKLFALIHPDMEAAQKAGLDNAALAKQMNENIKELNSRLPGYSQVSGSKLFEEEFEKTPKHSIKRYLYQ